MNEKLCALLGLYVLQIMVDSPLLFEHLYILFNV